MDEKNAPNANEEKTPHDQGRDLLTGIIIRGTIKLQKALPINDDTF